MKITENELVEIIGKAVETAVKDTIKALEEKNMLGNPNQKTAYQKTEMLLYNYRNFQRIVEEKEEEIEELRKYGVRERAKSIVEYSVGSCTARGIVLPEESVENAVHAVQSSVQDTVHVLSIIDSGMNALKNDPYFAILEMRYFDGRTQEDIAYELNCTQKTVSVNKARLVRELSLRIFPDQVVGEIMN